MADNSPDFPRDCSDLSSDFLGSILQRSPLDDCIRDWSHLPRDLLGLILQRLALDDCLLAVVDCIRFGAVCLTWNSVMAEWHPSRQIPWLMLPGDSSPDCEMRNFYCLSDHKTYRIHLPEIRGRRCIGSVEGWLVYINEAAELRILNPITRAQFTLPSITTLSGMKGVVRNADGCITHYIIDDSNDFSVEDPYPYDPEQTGERYHYKTIMSEDPSSGSCTVVTIHAVAKKLAFAKPGDESWTVLDLPVVVGFSDAIFHKGHLYAVTHSGSVLSCDLTDPSSPKVGKILPDWEVSSQGNYLVELSGDLLQVLRYATWVPLDGDNNRAYLPGDVYKTYLFKVFKLDPSASKWIEVKSLGDYSVFLGNNYTIALSTQDFPELRPNCIYFTEDDEDQYLSVREACRDLGVFNLEDGHIEPYYPRDSQLNWPPPIWVVPKLF